MTLLRAWLTTKEALPGWALFNAEGEKLTPVSMTEVLRSHMAQVVSNAECLTSYSWRRFLPSLAGLLGLPDADRLALGDWQDSSVDGRRCSLIQHRYDATRAQHALSVKILLQDVQRIIGPLEILEDLAAMDVPAVLQKARAFAEDRMAREKNVEWQNPHICMGGRRSFQLKRSFARAAAPRQAPEAIGG